MDVGLIVASNLNVTNWLGHVTETRPAIDETTENETQTQAETQAEKQA